MSKFKKVALIPALVLSLGALGLASCGDKPTVETPTTETPTTETPTTEAPTTAPTENSIPEDLVMEALDPTALGLDNWHVGDGDITLKPVLKSASNQAAATALRKDITVTSADETIIKVVGQSIQAVKVGTTVVTVALPNTTLKQDLTITVLGVDNGIAKTCAEINKAYSERVYVEAKILCVFDKGATGYVIADATGTSYVYAALPEGFKVGDVVIVSGITSLYHGIGEFVTDSTIKLNVYASEATINVDASVTTAVEFTKAKYEAFTAQADGAVKPVYISSNSFAVVQKGEFLSYTMGGSTLIGRFAYKYDPALGGFELGKTYTVKGWMYSRAVGEGGDFFPTEKVENKVEELTSFTVAGPTSVGVGTIGTVTANVNEGALGTFKLAIKEGQPTDIVSINGSKFTGLKAGTVTLVATADGDNTKTAEYTVEVKELPAPKTVTTYEEIVAETTKKVLMQAEVTLKEITKAQYGNSVVTLPDGKEIAVYGLCGNMSCFSMTDDVLKLNNDQSFESLGLKVGDKFKINFIYAPYKETAQISGVLVPSETKYTVTIPTTFPEHLKSLVSDAGEGVVMGTKVTLTATVDDGFEIESIKVLNGTSEIAVSKESALVYSFTMPMANVTVEVTVQAKAVIPEGVKATFDFTTNTGTADITDAEAIKTHMNNFVKGDLKVTEVTAFEKVYQGYNDYADLGMKFGASRANGVLTFKVSAAVTAAKITYYGWNTSDVVSVNEKDCKGVSDTYKAKIGTEDTVTFASTDTISIVFTKRGFISKIELL